MDCETTLYYKCETTFAEDSNSKILNLSDVRGVKE